VVRVDPGRRRGRFASGLHSRDPSFVRPIAAVAITAATRPALDRLGAYETALIDGTSGAFSWEIRCKYSCVVYGTQGIDIAPDLERRDEHPDQHGAHEQEAIKEHPA
jgi:hypothetical protein